MVVYNDSLVKPVKMAIILYNKHKVDRSRIVLEDSMEVRA